MSLSEVTVKVNVDKTELDTATEKAEKLIELMKEAKSLSADLASALQNKEG